MNVLFATTHAYPPYRVGGSESSTHDLCLTLPDFGVDVAVLSSSLRRRSTGTLDLVRSFPRRTTSVARDEDCGYPVFRAPSPAAATRAVVAEVRPDVAVIQAGRSLALAERLARLRVPCLVYLRDDVFSELGGMPHQQGGLRYAATSRDLANRFEAEFGIAATVIPPVVRPDRYRVTSSGAHVTFVCPFPVKGVDIALGLARRRLDVPFVFVESWELNPLRAAALKRRLPPNVLLRSPVPDMREVYAETKIVLVPSRWSEAWGRVVSEAQVSGIPALASARGGLPESVGPGGVLVDPNAGVDRWADALARLWDDEVEYERLARLAGEHALRPEFQPRTVAAELVAELQRVARGLH